MRLKNRYSYGIFLALFVSAELFGASTGSFRSYGVKSALINYEIKGTGVLSKENNLSIEGRGALVFDDWGAKKYFAEKYIESTQGIVQKSRTVRTLHREEYGNVFKVDFEKQRVETSRNLVLIDAIEKGKDIYQEQLQQLQEKGKRGETSSVLGLRCDEWLIDSKKICYFKGVPLKEEYMLSGISVTKTAIFAEFDKNISEDTFALPEFEMDKQKGFLIEKMPTAPAPQKQTAETNESNQTAELKKEKTTIVAQMAQGMFEEHKALLPKLLQEMLEARVCLENAEDRIEANECIAKVIETAELISGQIDKESEITVWTKVAKEAMLEEYEEGIMDMKRRMPCIRGSRDLDDLTACMQDGAE